MRFGDFKIGGQVGMSPKNNFPTFWYFPKTCRGMSHRCSYMLYENCNKRFISWKSSYIGGGKGNTSAANQLEPATSSIQSPGPSQTTSDIFHHFSKLQIFHIATRLTGELSRVHWNVERQFCSRIMFICSNNFQIFCCFSLKDVILITQWFKINDEPLFCKFGTILLIA